MAPFLAALLLAAAPAPASAGPGGVALPPCSGDLCHFANPEDLAALPGTTLIAVSQQSADDPGKGLLLLDTRDGRRIAIATPPADDRCPAGRGGGIGVRREDGGYRLVRIVHGASDMVETWRVTMAAGVPRLARTGCVAAPAPLFLNDIAPLPDGGFVATHMFDRALPAATRNAMFLAGQPTGSVMRWSASSGWAAIPNSQGVFPNGIDVSADGRWIAFAETYGHRLNRLRLDGSARTSVALAMQPDNVTALRGSAFVVVGGTGAPMVSTRNCAALKSAGCAFPAAAMIVDFKSGGTTTLARSAGVGTPGFSVGLLADGALWLGTSFGDRVTRVDVFSPPAELP